MKRLTEPVLVLAIMLFTASVCYGQFTSVPPGFTQATFGTSTSFLGGVAFAPNGDVWADDCTSNGGQLFRFPLQGHPVAVNSGTSGLTGCGLTNHPNGKLYSNTYLGVAELSNPVASTTAPALLRTIGSPGNALGITVDPQTNHLVYVGYDCRNTPTCTIYDLDPAQSTTSTPIVSLPNAIASLVDGIAFDPSGNFLFLSTRSRWDATTQTYKVAYLLTILRRNGVLVRQVSNDHCNDGCVSEPDGIAFHAGSPQFVVTDNTDGTISRFEFPNNDFTMIPTVTEFASGGLRGDLSQVGPDGCLYISQDTLATGVPSDIAQICGVFASSTNSQSVTLTFSPSATPETQIATIGDPSDPAAQSLALTLASVTNPINVTVTFFYEPTDLSTGTHGVGIADGVCEISATEDTDFDCRLAANFTYPSQTLLRAGDRLVPHIIPSHNNLGVWVRVTATRVSDGQPAVPGTDYSGPVDWYYAWNANPPLVGSPGPTITSTIFTGAPNPDYPPGWNNQNPQMYDRPGENTSIAFTKNITTYSKFICTPTCVGKIDPGTGGRTPTLNDIVVGAPPNPPAGSTRVVEPLVPVPGISPFPYLSGVPMLVAFELEKAGTEITDPTALTPPHSVNVATLVDQSGIPIPVQFPKGFPTTFTYNPTLKTYFIFLSPAPYKTDGTVYTLQIGSDLFPQPVNLKFVVKKFR